LQQLRVSWSNDATLASLLADTVYTDRTMAYYGDLEKKITALKPEQVTAALKKFINPKRLFIVNAGDFSAAAEPAK
jgi:zinc protease